MTDKEIFKAELDRLKEETYIGLSEHDNGVEQGRMEVINSLYKTLHHMQEEPVSEDLEEIKEIQWEAMQYTSSVAKESTSVRDWCTNDVVNAFKAGAKWQKQQMMKDAVEARFTLLDGFCIDRELYKNYEVGKKYKLIIIKDE